jgi:hypothetical protein
MEVAAQPVSSSGAAVVYLPHARMFLKGALMQSFQVETSEASILSRILKPETPSLTAAAAKAILEFDFDDADKERMHELSVKAQEGTLSSREQAALNNFERVGHLIGLMKSKARRSLKARQGTNGKNKNH